jgi:hypothetical protein
VLYGLSIDQASAYTEHITMSLLNTQQVERREEKLEVQHVECNKAADKAYIANGSNIPDDYFTSRLFIGTVLAMGLSMLSVRSAEPAMYS